MSQESGGVPTRQDSVHLPTLFASLVVGVAFLSFWLWLLPRWLGLHVQAAQAEPWRWLFAIPAVFGFALGLKSVWDFGATGHGTPAPIAPPKKLVVVGFYRYTRNPMYVGFAVGWIGLWIVFGHFNWTLAIAAALVALGVDLFVRFYEEPTLRKKFSGDYEEYCRNVPRWWPRVTPWKKN